jgi:hypothetical protein
MALVKWPGFEHSWPDVINKIRPFFRSIWQPEEIFGMQEVEYYKKIGSDFPKIFFGFFLNYGQFSPKEKPS